MSKRVKIFAIIILVIAVLIYIGSKFGHSTPKAAPNGLDSTADDGTSTSDGSTAPLNPAPVAGQQSAATDQSGEFSSLLSQVTSINIDDSIFNMPAYKALRDNPITLGTDVVGRTNPFAPVGSDGTVNLTNPIVQTLQPTKVTSTSAELSASITFTTTAPVTVVFQYGTTSAFGSATTPVTLAKSGTAVATITGLSPNTPYQVQAVAVVGPTTTNGNTMSFTTTTAPGQ